MKNKKWILLAVCFCLCGLFVFQYFSKPVSTRNYAITNLRDAYNADAEISKALLQMNQNQDKAVVITRVAGKRQVAIIFEGLSDRATTQKILGLLKKYQVQATFFIDGVQAAQDPHALTAILNYGQKIENYTLTGKANMENMAPEALVRDFSCSQKIIKVLTDKQPDLLTCNATKYTDVLLHAAKSSGLCAVVKSSAYLPVKNINSLLTAKRFVGQLQPGSIISIRLSRDAQIIPNEEIKTDQRPAIDKQPGLKELPPSGEIDNHTVAAVEQLLLALQEANYAITTLQVPKTSFLQRTKERSLTFLTKGAEVFGTLFRCRVAYAAERPKAAQINYITTTEPALSYTFGGLSNKPVVYDVLETLHQLGIKGTFFVMGREIKRDPETVQAIIDAGHEIGIAIAPKKGADFEQIRQNITHSQALLYQKFGITARLIKQPWGAVTDDTKEAVAAMHCQLIGQSMNVIQTRYKDYTSVDAVMAGIFPKSSHSLAKGDIVYFRMDYYQDNTLVVKLLKAIKQCRIDNIAYATYEDNPAGNPSNDSQYMIKPVGEILNNTRFTYKFPVNLHDIPESLRIDEHPLQYKNFMQELAKRYIGNRDVNYDDRMLGFSQMETRRLDISGLVRTKDNVVFLTFDDWGEDAAINKLLYVLRKHNATATFFVLTHNMLYNPNLLRSIAEAGNSIGCHTNLHMPMAIIDPTGRQVATEDKQAYTKDVSTAYQKLLEVVGDVTVNGKPTLTGLFRPPQLAISKMGCEALLTVGYRYIVSGSCDSQDWAAQSVAQILNTIKREIYTPGGKLKKGSIIIMHMGDDCIYTPIALDILLSANEAKADSDPTKFRVGRLADYLQGGYAQIK